MHKTPHRPIYPQSMVMMVPDVYAGKSEAKKSPYLGVKWFTGWVTEGWETVHFFLSLNSASAFKSISRNWAWIYTNHTNAVLNARLT